MVRVKKDVRQRVKTYMLDHCKNCSYADNCKDYENMDYWMDTFTKLDKDGNMECRTCPKFRSLMVFGKLKLSA